MTMKKALVGALIGLLLALSGFAIVTFVYYPRIDELHHEIQALEEELATLKNRLQTLQETSQSWTDLLKLYVENGSQIRYDLKFTLNSTSMLPTLMVGDIVYLQMRVNGSSIEVDDIIAFFNPNAWSTITIHRVVEKQYVGEDFLYYTQGDNKSTRDPWPISVLNVIGTVVAYRRGDVVDVIEG
jgi:signal peptidase I